MSFSWLFLGGVVSTRARLRFTNRGQRAVNSVRWSRIFQRTAKYLLTGCLTPRGQMQVLASDREGKIQSQCPLRREKSVRTPTHPCPPYRKQLVRPCWRSGVQCRTSSAASVRYRVPALYRQLLLVHQLRSISSEHNIPRDSRFPTRLYAEVNKFQYGKNAHKKIGVFSGEHILPPAELASIQNGHPTCTAVRNVTMARRRCGTLAFWNKSHSPRMLN